MCPRCGFRTNRFSLCPNDGTGLVRDISLDLVIVGGESGPNARPCDVSWIRSIVRQCAAAGVACFVKQLGKWVADDSWMVGERHTADYAWLAHAWLFPGGRVWVPGIIGEHNYQRPADAIAFTLRDSHGGDPEEWPEDLRVREFPVSDSTQEKGNG